MKSLFVDDATGAFFSPCRTWRYKLWRVWDDRKPLVNYLMLNPSIADADFNDNTVKGAIERSRRAGFGGIIVTNLFALVSTDRNVLFGAADPVGPQNDVSILSGASRCQMTVCGWGEYGGIKDRDKAVLKLLAGRELHALNVNKDGRPTHPLYIGYDVKPKMFRSAT